MGKRVKLITDRPTPEVEPEKKERKQKRVPVLSVFQRRANRSKKLDKDTRRLFLEAIREGLPETLACQLCKISFRWYSEKKKQSIRYLDDGHVPEGGCDTIDHWAEFIEEVQAEIAMFQLDHIREGLSVRASKEGKRGWVRNMTVLERRDRDNWGRNESLTITETAYDDTEAFL